MACDDVREQFRGVDTDDGCAVGDELQVLRGDNAELCALPSARCGDIELGAVDGSVDDGVGGVEAALTWSPLETSGMSLSSLANESGARPVSKCATCASSGHRANRSRGHPRPAR
jgi:hypothetical protein